MALKLTCSGSRFDSWWINRWPLLPSDLIFPQEIGNTVSGSLRLVPFPLLAKWSRKDVLFNTLICGVPNPNHYVTVTIPVGFDCWMWLTSLQSFNGVFTSTLFTRSCLSRYTCIWMHPVGDICGHLWVHMVPRGMPTFSTGLACHNQGILLYLFGSPYLGQMLSG